MLGKKSFFLILLLAFFFRLLLTPKTFHVDLVLQAEWGQRAYQQGLVNFYNHPDWIFSRPNHPPLTILYYKANYILYRKLSLLFNRSALYLLKIKVLSPSSFFYQFVQSLDKIASADRPFPLGYLLTLKLFPIFCDLLIASLLYFMAKKYSPWPLVYPFLFLLIPFSWYTSSLWGQTDQLSFLFLITAFLLLKKTPSLSIFLFYLSLAIKPTSAPLSFLFLFLLIKNHTKIMSYLIGIALSLFTTFITFKPFYSSNIYDFLFHQLLPRLVDRPARLSTNLYNFWHLFCLNRPVTSEIKFLFITATVWSLLLFLLIHLILFIKIKNFNLKNTLLSLFVISFSSYFFLTNMLDRYAYTALLSALFVAIFYPKTLVYWLLSALVFSLNLYRLWWYPSSIEYLHQLLTYKNYLIGIPLSLLNFLAFILTLKTIAKKNKQQKAP